MSSKAANALTGKFKAAFVFPALSAAFLLGAPVAAQDDAAVTETADEAQETPQPEPRARPRRDIINLSVTVPREESDRLLEEDCEEEADAAQIAGEIVVCRQLGEATDGSWDKEDFERRYAERTQGRQPVNTFGIPNHGNPISIGSVPEPALMIDVEALPQAPAGSDADRIARGLPPLGEAELSPEEIAKRRRELGLEAPPLPEQGGR